MYTTDEQFFAMCREETARKKFFANLTDEQRKSNRQVLIGWLCLNPEKSQDDGSNGVRYTIFYYMTSVMNSTIKMWYTDERRNFYGLTTNQENDLGRLNKKNNGWQEIIEYLEKI